MVPLTKSSRGQRIKFATKRAAFCFLIVAIIILSSNNFSEFRAQASISSALNITEWQVPTGSSGPDGIAVDNTGRVWFAENDSGRLGMLDPASNNMYEWTLPSGSSVNSHSIFTSPAVAYSRATFRAYFAEYSRDKVAYLDTTSPTPTVTSTVTSTTTTITSTTTTTAVNQLTEWSLPFTGSNPTSIFVDDQGNMWFPESGRDAIGELMDAASNTNTEYIEWELPGSNASAGTCGALCVWGIYVQKAGGDYYVWFTERTGGRSDTGQVGRLQLSNNLLTLWDLSALGGTYQPYDIAVDSVGNAYFSNYLGNKISILSNDGSYREYAIGTQMARPQAVTLDPAHGALWFAESLGNNFAYLNYSAPAQSASPSVSQCVIPSTITLTTTIVATRTSYTTTTNLNPNIGTCGFGESLESAEVSMVPTTKTVSAPNVAYGITPSTRPLGNAQGPVNGISEYALPSSNSRPYSLALDDYDNLWITENDHSANRIGKVTFPTDFNIQLQPNSQVELAVTQGGVVTYSLYVSPVSGLQSPVSLSVDTAAGLTANFNPSIGVPPFQSTLTITTSASTPLSTYVMSVIVSSASATHSLCIALTVLSSSPTVTATTSQGSVPGCAVSTFSTVSSSVTEVATSTTVIPEFSTSMAFLVSSIVVLVLAIGELSRFPRRKRR
jgi:virginiamycin B lyase